jgi:hypothetical protein
MGLFVEFTTCSCAGVIRCCTATPRVHQDCARRAALLGLSQGMYMWRDQLGLAYTLKVVPLLSETTVIINTLSKCMPDSLSRMFAAPWYTRIFLQRHEVRLMHATAYNCCGLCISTMTVRLCHMVVMLSNVEMI